MLEAASVIQWCLYYPAVLDLEEVDSHRRRAGGPAPSLAAYRQGDLVAALAAYHQHAARFLHRNACIRPRCAVFRPGVRAQVLLAAIGAPQSASLRWPGLCDG